MKCKSSSFLFIHVFFIITFCSNTYCYGELKKFELIIEQGGIDNYGNLSDHKSRLRTNLMPRIGCIKLNPGFAIMNCMKYNSDGSFVGFVNLHFLNGYYYWEEDKNIRISFYYEYNSIKKLTKEEQVIDDSSFDDVNDLLERIADEHLPKVLDLEWKTIIRTEEYDVSSKLRIPLLITFKNGDVFLCCEEHKANSKIAHITAISRDGKLFRIDRTRIPIQSLVYDKLHDRLFNITVEAIYYSDDHGDTWSKSNDNAIVIPHGYHSVATSPTVGIQLKNGIMVLPMRAICWKKINNRHRIIEDECVFLFYSRDFGKTWEQSHPTPSGIICDESELVEYLPNQIMLNARGGTEHYWNKTYYGRRVMTTCFVSHKSRKKWCPGPWIIDKTDGCIWDPLCRASLIKGKIRSRNYYLFCNPYMPYDFTPRRNLLLQYSYDCSRWNPIGIISPLGEIIYGYSCISTCGETIFIAYEAKDGIRLCNVSSFVWNALFPNNPKN